MTREERAARTEARRKAGANQTYPHHAGRAQPAPAATAARPLPLRMAACPHLGERVPGEPCGSPLLACNLHGGTTARLYPCSRADRCCQSCDDHPAASLTSPGESAAPLTPIAPVQYGPVPVAPLHPAGWQGAVSPKPHEYALTVAIPHLDTLGQLRLCLDLWRCQTARPYLVVVDTGSPWPVVEQLEKEVRAADCEVHYVRAHGYRHSSAPVSAALDLAQSRCTTEHLFHTHADVFPLRRDFLAWMLARSSAAAPLVGWQMSPRTKGEWSECVSHTATILHMPTVRAKGLWWAFERYYDERPGERGPSFGWPDTESPFMLACRAAGVKPLLLGPESNFEAHDLAAEGVAWAVHARSYTGLKAGAGSGPLWEKAKGYMARAEADARLRLAAWRAGRPGG